MRRLARAKPYCNMTYGACCAPQATINKQERKYYYISKNINSCLIYIPPTDSPWIIIIGQTCKSLWLPHTMNALRRIHCSLGSMLKTATLIAVILNISFQSSNAFTRIHTHKVSPLLPGLLKCRVAEPSHSALAAFKRSISKTDFPKKKREKNIKRLTANNDMMTSHRHRLQTAGKIGTKRYADPTMIFVGNLNFTVTDDQLKELVIPLVPSPWDVAKVQVVRDWKTGESKGFGFVRFTEAVFATLALQELDNKEYFGRRLKVKGANSSSESPLRKKQREEKERLKALRRAKNPPPPPPPAKNENAEFLALLDADLIIPTLDDNEGDDDGDDEVDGWEVPGSPTPKGFG